MVHAEGTPQILKSFTPSPYQQRIFDFVQSGHGNAIVEAVAGSGKTTTIVEALKFAKGSTIFLAFNKAIAGELKIRGVNARTFHSLCMPVVKAKGAFEITPDKTKHIMNAELDLAAQRTYGLFVMKLVGLAKQSGIGCLLSDSLENFIQIVNHHDLDVEDGDLGIGINLARKVLEASNKSRLVDFDDLLYLAVKDKVSLPKYDFVFVDEAQDTNAIQREILRKIMREGSRMVAVGDPAQAIYGFRGADSDSLELIASEFSCEKLPLTVTYRCGTSIVEYVKQWVSHIEAAPGAGVGTVTTTPWNPSVFGQKDLVVCRTTRPLIKLGYQMLKQKIPFFIMGKEIGNGLKSVIKKTKARDLTTLSERLSRWCDNEVLKAQARDDQAKVENVKDKYEAIVCLMESLSHDEGVTALCNLIDKMFEEKTKSVVLATIHKSKGLEADRVWWLNYDQCPSKWAKKDWQQGQERNLCYVAATRAKSALFLISEEQ